MTRSSSPAGASAEPNRPTHPADLPGFSILGPLTVATGDRRTGIRSRRQRAILTLLLLAAPRPVSMDSLIDAVWPTDPPTTARNQIHICVSALRSMFSRMAGDELVETVPTGYALPVPPEHIDLRIFQLRAAEAREHADAGDLETATAVIRDALSLWRGPLGNDLDGPAVAAAAARAAEELTAAQDCCAEWDLALGRHEELIGELSERVAQHPLQEQPLKLLMVALRQAGRSADALQVYSSGRRTFVDELGLEPGAEIRRIQSQILTGDPQPTSESEPDRPTIVPRQLPPGTPDFTGRDELLATAAHALLANRPADRGVPLVALVGAPGAGKTALAIHIAHRLTSTCFGDGQLVEDLRGSTGDPADPDDVIRRSLRTLGVSAAALPDEPEECLQLYRSLLADRSILVVLDDAGREEQVRPLLPATSSCAVLVTTRTRLDSLPGARSLTVGPLAPPEGVEFLTAVLGAERVTADLPAARRIVELAEGLPLALRVVASRLAARPRWSLRSMVFRLLDGRRGLDELGLRDLSVRDGIDSAYCATPAAERALLRLLARIPADPFRSTLAATVLDVDQPTADELLENLADAHLVVPADGGAYRIPWPVHLYLQEVNAPPDVSAGAESPLPRPLSETVIR